MAGGVNEKTCAEKRFLYGDQTQPRAFPFHLFIVAIGCAFFSGIRASEPDMRYSGDAYFDNKNMMDLRIISTMGLTEDDVKAASKAEGIGHVEGRYSVDALLADGDNQIVVHVMSMLPTMNEIQLEDGRLPNKENECVVDVDYMEKAN